ncbi:MAG: galactose mutarotase [Acidobacteriota bacterium]|nr:galactose mutarotase [Acidobacteriota bacterium]
MITGCNKQETAATNAAPAGASKSGAVRSDFGKMPDGTPISIYTLTNAKGMEARIMTYGGILVSVKAPDRLGSMGDVVLGHDSIADYAADHKTYFGALIGRYANRIGGAQFHLDGVAYKLPVNDGKNSLHGGPEGFDKKVWTGKEVPNGVELTYVSKDGEAGYPGTLTAVVTYTLSDDNALRIHYTATTDKDTVVNLTNHSYWNLKGDGDILGNLLTINADTYTPIDAGLIPTGEMKSVAGTPFDFRQPTAVGARITDNDPQLKLGHGYDHNWVLNKNGATGLTLAARVEEPTYGRVMEVYTDQPGIQFYTGNFLDGTVNGKGGKPALIHSALCLETQHYPDTPNKPKFPSAELKPGEKYDTTTEFRFSAK